MIPLMWRNVIKIGFVVGTDLDHSIVSISIGFVVYCFRISNFGTCYVLWLLNGLKPQKYEKGSDNCAIPAMRSNQHQLFSLISLNDSKITFFPENILETNNISRISTNYFNKQFCSFLPIDNKRLCSEWELGLCNAVNNKFRAIHQKLACNSHWCVRW